VTIILLLSSLSVLTILTSDVKAEEQVGTTTLYFHEQITEDDDLSYILEVYNEEKLLDLLYKSGLEENLTEPELENLSDIEYIKLILSISGYGRVMDQNPPIKTNDSEYPPTIKTIIDMCRKGEWEELLSEEFLVSYFAPFQGAYVYSGEEKLDLKGDVNFNLYFASPPWYLWDNDTVNVSFLVLKILGDEELQTKFTESKEVKVKRKLLSPLKDTIEYKFSIPVETVLEPGDVILAEIKISAGDKLLLNYVNFDLSSLNETLKSLGEALSNISFLSNLSETLLKLSEIFGSEEFAGFNITEFIEMMSSSFIYDSVNHKSSMTLPCSITGEVENIRTYYLHSENKMSSDPPENDKPSVATISKNPAKWSSLGLERNKLIEAATASLYVDHRDMRRLINILRGKIKVVATLLDGNTTISSSEKELDRTGILDLLQKPSEPILFNFDCKNYEIYYGKNLTLKVSATDNKLGLFRMANLLYDSVNYPSSLTVKFNETGHIKIVDVVKNPSDEKIALGDSIIYTFNVTSKYNEDNIQLSFSKKDNDKWGVTITPNKFSLAAGGKQNVTAIVKSKATKYDKDRYGDVLRGKFVAEGKTGKFVYPVNVEISEDAVEYRIGIAGQSQEIKYGKNGTYVFKVKNLNTGFWPDTYNIKVESEHNWKLNLSKDEIKNIAAGDEVEVKVTIFVPKNTSASSDLLKFIVTSKEGKKTVALNVTTTVIGPNILEWIYDAFDSASYSLGLNAVFGSYGAHVLAIIIFVIIFFIIILLVYLLTIKYANLICLERIKEIQPGEQAKFNITLQNPYKRRLSYEIYTKYPSSSGWNVSLDINNVSLESKQSRDLTLRVTPTSFVKADDWIEVVVGVKVLEKQKNIEISTVTTIKDAKPDLHITDVIHSPEVFKKGDRVDTSFKLENRGKVAATHVNVILYVNGEEKNKVEDITIPSGGYAEIRMPWIASKRKNEFNIVVK
jgi:large-conductance mechanosensitive channel